MDWTNLPPLNALKAFAALAETESFSQAGRALNVTHAAVIQQVKSLEARLGVALAVRDGRGVKLTPEGAALARDLAAGFASISKGVEALGEADTQRPVQITTSPAFAVSWLMPRLVDFQRSHPSITLMLNPTAELVDMRAGGIDLAIRYCDQSGVRDDYDVLFSADMVVVGTPSLIGARQVSGPEHLTGLPWLQELGTTEVADWFERHHVALDRSLINTQMPGNLIMEAVRRGDGLTYTPRPFVEKDIRAGRLVVLFCDKAFGHFFLRTGHRVLRKPVEIFIRWLKRQAAADGSVRH